MNDRCRKVFEVKYGNFSIETPPEVTYVGLERANGVGLRVEVGKNVDVYYDKASQALFIYFNAGLVVIEMNEFTINSANKYLKSEGRNHIEIKN